MEIQDIIDDKDILMEDFCADTFEELMETLELSGDIFLSKYGMERGDSYLFYLGPAFGPYPHGISDSAHIDNYLQNICQELNIKDIKIGAAENAHNIKGVLSNGHGSLIVDKITDRIKEDGFYIWDRTE